MGFDAWRTLRSGHPEAGRIALIAPEIDFSGGSGRATAGPTLASGVDIPALGRVAVLQRWRGGRIDIEGGTLRFPGRGGNANLFNVQIRRATLRRSDDEWSVVGLMFLPDRVGRTARVNLRVQGDLGDPAQLGGSLRVEARRVLFPGCRDFLAGLQGLAPYLPRAGNGDLTVDLNFARGRIVEGEREYTGGGVGV